MSSSAMAVAKGLFVLVAEDEGDALGVGGQELHGDDGEEAGRGGEEWDSAWVLEGGECVQDGFEYLRQGDEVEAVVFERREEHAGEAMGVVAGGDEGVGDMLRIAWWVE